MKNRLLLALVVFSAVSCRQSGANDFFENCPSGKPEAILSKEIQEVKKHRFQLRREEAVEEVVFESGKELTILQTGCDFIRQEFQFTLPGAFSSEEPSFWQERAVEEFQYLASLGPSYLMFSSWAQAIGSKTDFHLAESQEIQPGFFVRIDRINAPDHAILTVTLSEQP